MFCVSSSQYHWLVCDPNNRKVRLPCMRAISSQKLITNSRIYKSLQIPNRDTTRKLHSVYDDATPFRRCMLVGVLPRIGLFNHTYFDS